MPGNPDKIALEIIEMAASRGNPGCGFFKLEIRFERPVRFSCLSGIRPIGTKCQAQSDENSNKNKNNVFHVAGFKIGHGMNLSKKSDDAIQ